MLRVFRVPGIALACASFLALGNLMPAAATSGPQPNDSLVTNGSPVTPFPQNKQNEPGVAIDANNPSVVAAGSNDEIDLAPCNGISCPFTPGVGVSGIYFSLNGGNTWTQPTYTGYSARTGTPTPNGPIGTLPWYYENGLASDGDPALAFGPRPGTNGKFSWSNGSRLYYINLTSKLSAPRSEEVFKGFEAIAVSRTDHALVASTGGAAGKAAWMPPVLVSQQISAATFSDKEDVWADNAYSSPHFGNAYACWTDFRSNSRGNGGAEPILFSRSINGGTTWSPQLRITSVNSNKLNGRQGCTIRTDSHGVVYVFWEDTVAGQSKQFMTRSFDGGVSFDQRRAVGNVTDVGLFDPVSHDFTFDGLAGARTDSFPSVDIANGAPTGSDATNEIVMTWSQGPTPTTTAGSNEQALVQYSFNGGNTWSTPLNGADSSDRPDFPAVAIAPDGSKVYLTYDAFHAPWQSTTTNPRVFEGVVRDASSSLTGFTTLHRGDSGDARASSANALVDEFLGDYNYAAASRTFAVAVWNDARNGADCPAIDAYRASLATSNPLPAPSPATGCLATFGNTDIYGGQFTP